MTGNKSVPFITKQTLRIFLGVFLYGFIYQVVLRTAGNFLDSAMWTDQIQYLLNRDPRGLDFYRAYGHPGTTILELGSLFHSVFGISYFHAFKLSMSFILAGSIAACAAVSSILFRNSHWWLMIALILHLDRPYLNATPPTSAVMPFIVLIVLASWWLWERFESPRNWHYILLGSIIGLAAATRLDAALLVGLAMVGLMRHRFGNRSALLILAGASMSFFAADPFLWFMPITHLTDLIRKFTIHFEEHTPTKIGTADLIRALLLPAVSLAWSLGLLARQRFSRLMPVPIIIGYIIVSILSLIVVLSS